MYYNLVNKYMKLYVDKPNAIYKLNNIELRLNTFISKNIWILNKHFDYVKVSDITYNTKGTLSYQDYTINQLVEKYPSPQFFYFTLYFYLRYILNVRFNLFTATSIKKGIAFEFKTTFIHDDHLEVYNTINRIKYTHAISLYDILKNISSIDIRMIMQHENDIIWNEVSDDNIEPLEYKVLNHIIKIIKVIKK